MKATRRAPKIQLTAETHVFAADIGKDKVSWVFCPARVGSAAATELLHVREIDNNSPEIRDCLKKLLPQAGGSAGNVLVACEATGLYNKKLLAEARDLGMDSVLANGRVVHRLEGLESNDDGKSDERDPRVILKLVLLKSGLLTDVHLEGAYARLRNLHEQHDFQSRQSMEARCRMHPTLLKLFPDLKLSSKQIFGSAGQAFRHLYKFNPWRARDAGREKFMEEMARHLRDKKSQARKKTLAQLWSEIDASTSGRRPDSGLLADMEEHAAWLFKDIDTCEERKEKLRLEMLKSFGRTKEATTLASVTVSEFDKARIIAETGPLDNYLRAAQVLRMAGLAIRIRESGKYKGLNKITKTGRALLRKCLFQIVFGLCGSKNGLLRKKNEELKKRCGGTKAAANKTGKKRMVQLMRKLLTAIFAVHRSGREFKAERLFAQEQKDTAA